MANYGLKIAKWHQDTGDTDKFMIQHSKYPTLKLQSSGQGSLATTSGNGGSTVEITHSLGYKPIVFVSGKWIPYEGTAVGSRYGNWNRWIYQGVQESDYYFYYVDNTKLYIVVELSTLTDDADYSFDYMYHIFYDEDTLA